MRFRVKENKSYSVLDLASGFFPQNAPLLEEKYEGVIYTGTARAALRIILDFLKAKGEIANKNTEVIISQWLCTSVYQVMHKVCFPALAPSSNTKGIIVYHQYGFPQDMDEILSVARDKKWFVMENCVNVYESYYKGRKVGTFGLAAIFSLSKMFPSVQGGALASANEELRAFAQAAVSRDHDYLVSSLAHVSRILTDMGEHPFFNMIQEMAYGKIDSAKRISKMSLNLARRDMRSGAMKRRQENYHLALETFREYDFFQNLERDVVPYVLPLVAKEDVLARIKEKLMASGIWTDLYHFDVNRNLLRPQFKRCVWIPVHQGIGRSEMERICSLIRSAL